MGRKRVIKPRFWLLMIGALLLIFACVYISQGQLMQRQNTRLTDLQAQLIQKQSTNAQLERKIAFAKTDEYVQRVAHEELGLLYEDEIKFVAAQSQP